MENTTVGSPTISQDEIHSLADVSLLIGELLDEFDASKTKEGTFLAPYFPGRFPFHLWFRGEPLVDETQLLPSVLRPCEDGRFRDETAMFSYARSRYPQFRAASSDVLSALCKMQHYQVPTRLLDWTESLGTALYFAVRDRSERDSLLFCLNARKLNQVTSMESKITNLHDEESFGTKFRCSFVLTDTCRSWYQSVAKEDSFRWNEVAGKVSPAELFEGTPVPTAALPFHGTPVAVLPAADDPRVLQQRSVFTLHGGKRYNGAESVSDDRLPEPKSMLELQAESEDKWLIPLRVPYQAKERLRFELQALGFHEATLFSDTDTLGTSVKEMF